MDQRPTWFSENAKYDSREGRTIEVRRTWFGVRTDQPEKGISMSRRTLTSLAASVIVGVACIATVSTDAFAYRRGVAGVARGGVYHGGVNRVGVNRVGIGYGGAGIGYRGAALAYRGGWNGYYRRGLGVAAGVAVGTAAAGAYYGDSGYASGGYASGAYASSAYDESGGYTLNGTYMSEADAVAYCAQRFRSYDIESRTFLAYSGERMSCPVQ